MPFQMDDEMFKDSVKGFGSPTPRGWRRGTGTSKWTRETNPWRLTNLENRSAATSMMPDFSRSSVFASNMESSYRGTDSPFSGGLGRRSQVFAANMESSLRGGSNPIGFSPRPYTFSPNLGVPSWQSGLYGRMFGGGGGGGGGVPPSGSGFGGFSMPSFNRPNLDWSRSMSGAAVGLGYLGLSASVLHGAMEQEHGAEVRGLAVFGGMAATGLYGFLKAPGMTPNEARHAGLIRRVTEVDLAWNPDGSPKMTAAQPATRFGPARPARQAFDTHKYYVGTGTGRFPAGVEVPLKDLGPTWGDRGRNIGKTIFSQRTLAGVAIADMGVQGISAMTAPSLAERDQLGRQFMASGAGYASFGVGARFGAALPIPNPIARGGVSVLGGLTTAAIGTGATNALMGMIPMSDAVRGSMELQGAIAGDRADVLGRAAQLGGFELPGARKDGLTGLGQTFGEGISTYGDFFLGANNPLLIGARTAFAPDKAVVDEMERSFMNDLSDRGGIFSQVSPGVAAQKLVATAALNYDTLSAKHQWESFRGNLKSNLKGYFSKSTDSEEAQFRAQAFGELGLLQTQARREMDLAKAEAKSQYLETGLLGMGWQALGVGKIKDVLPLFGQDPNQAAENYLSNQNLNQSALTTNAGLTAAVSGNYGGAKEYLMAKQRYERMARFSNEFIEAGGREKYMEIARQGIGQGISQLTTAAQKFRFNAGSIISGAQSALQALAGGGHASSRESVTSGAASGQGTIAYMTSRILDYTGTAMPEMAKALLLSGAVSSEKDAMRLAGAGGYGGGGGNYRAQIEAEKAQRHQAVMMSAGFDEARASIPRANIEHIGANYHSFNLDVANMGVDPGGYFESVRRSHDRQLGIETQDYTKSVASENERHTKMMATYKQEIEAFSRINTPQSQERAAFARVGQAQEITRHLQEVENLDKYLQRTKEDLRVMAEGAEKAGIEKGQFGLRNMGFSMERSLLGQQSHVLSLQHANNLNLRQNKAISNAEYMRQEFMLGNQQAQVQLGYTNLAYQQAQQQYSDLVTLAGGPGGVLSPADQARAQALQQQMAMFQQQGAAIAGMQQQMFGRGAFQKHMTAINAQSAMQYTRPFVSAITRNFGNPGGMMRSLGTAARGLGENLLNRAVAHGVGSIMTQFQMQGMSFPDDGLYSTGALQLGLMDTSIPGVSVGGQSLGQPVGQIAGAAANLFGGISTGGLGPIQVGAGSDVGTLSLFGSAGGGLFSGLNQPIQTGVFGALNKGVGTLAGKGGVLGKMASRFQKANGFSVGNIAGGLVGGLAGHFINKSIYSEQTTAGSIGSMIGGTVGAIVGQAVIPIPFVGAAIGALAGTLLGGLGNLFGGGKKDQMEQQQLYQQYQQQVSDHFSTARPDTISNLFDGRGDFDADMAAITPFTSMGWRSIGQSMKNGPAKTAARREFQRQSQQYLRAVGVASEFKDILEIQGGASGARYDFQLEQQRQLSSLNPFQSEAYSSLFRDYVNLQEGLAEVGTTPERIEQARGLFTNIYEGQLAVLNRDINDKNRDFGFLERSVGLSERSRGIDEDMMTRRVTNFDRDSQRAIEGVMGTLQRRRNRSAVASELREEQSFQKDILLRRQSLLMDSNVLTGDREQASLSDMERFIGDLEGQRSKLNEKFPELVENIGNASDAFYTLLSRIEDLRDAIEGI